MKFKNTDELLEFMNSIDLEKSTLVFKEGDGTVAVSDGDCGCGGSDENSCACSTVTVEEEATATVVDSESVLVESFSDSPKFKLVLSEASDNIFYVKDYNAIKDACGTGSITLEDRVTYMNMCEMDNKAVVTLDIVTEGKKLKSVPFTLVKTEGQSFLQLSKTQLV